MNGINLTIWVNYIRARTLQARLVNQWLMENGFMATPAAISKLQEHAIRANSLLQDTDKVAEASGPILDNYEATLTRYKAGLSQVKANERALAAVLQSMGNATEILDGAFQDAKSPAAKTSVDGEQQTVKPGDVGKVEEVLRNEDAPKS